MGKSKTPLEIAGPIAEELIVYLKEHEKVERASIAGSIRRRRPEVQDIDLVVATSDPLSVSEYLAEISEGRAVQGVYKTRVIYKGLQVDLVTVPAESFGAALCYLTGSKEYNIIVRTIAKRQGLRVNEHGIFSAESGEYLGGKEERDLYDLVGIDYHEPEERERDILWRR